MHKPGAVVVFLSVHRIPHISFAAIPCSCQKVVFFDALPIESRTSKAIQELITLVVDRLSLLNLQN